MKIKKRTREPSPVAAPPRLTASTLAREAAAALGADPQQQEEMLSAALAVGQWLADQGRPGRWDTVDPAAVLDLMSFPRPEEGEPFLLALVGLFGHAAFTGQVAPEAGRRVLARIGELSRNRVISDLAAQTAAQLQITA
jgi:hypothetical protein